MIAHRPSALAAVDQVLVMADGEAKAFGPQGADHAPSAQQPAQAGARQHAGDGRPARSRRSSLMHAPRQKHPSIRRRSLLGGAAVAGLLAFGVGGWAATTEFAGAVIAPGSLVVDSNVKKVQHPTGGVVGELRVRDGDHVKAGDVVVRLDDTQTRANLAIVAKSLDELAARQARDEAERDGAKKVTFPAELLARTDDPEVAPRGPGRAAAVRDPPRSARGPEGAAARAHRPAPRRRSTA